MHSPHRYFKDIDMGVRSETRIPIRIYNYVAPKFRIRATGRLNPDELLETAAKKFGGDDFGDDYFLDGFRVLCHSLEADANLHASGQLFARNMILNSLHCRLELCRRWQQYPEVLEKPIKRPIFIVGAGRTGTTLLFDLLAQDDRFRFLRAWEARRPGLAHDNQTQMKKAKRKSGIELQMINYMRPELKKIHYMAPDKPEECNPLFTNSFEAVIYRYIFEVHSYYDWYIQQTHKYQYKYYKKQIQWMQGNTTGRRWLFKAPSHLAGFKSLVDQFPDAVLIQTHRDLVAGIPSNCSLKYNLLSMTSYKISKKEIGRFVMEDLGRNLRSTFDVRAENHLNILDIQYGDLIGKTMAVLKRIYEHIGEDFNENTQRRAMMYLASNPKNKFGRHHYSLEEFGLSRETIFEKFDFYNQALQTMSLN